MDIYLLQINIFSKKCHMPQFQDIRFRKDPSFRFFVGDMIVPRHHKNISYVAREKIYILA